MINEAFFQVLQKRRSVRSFKRKQVEEFKINTIVESCDLAPSAGGLQSYEIYQVKGNDKKNLLTRAAWDQMFISEAPLVLVFCANASRSVYKYGKQIGPLFTPRCHNCSSLCAARSSGLGTCKCMGRSI